jgi:hypothetical protein
MLYTSTTEVVAMSEFPVRTQVYLSKEMHRKLVERSRATGMSIAAQIREALAQYLTVEVKPRPDDPIWRLPQVGRSIGGTGLRDAARNHDKYIYDEDLSE